MTPYINNPKREELQAEIDAFLARGGKIKVLPYGPDSFKAQEEAQANVFTKHADRLQAARARGLANMNWRKQEEAKFNNNDISSETQRKRAQARKNRFKKAEKAEVAA